MLYSTATSSYHQTPSNDSVSTLGSLSAHLAPRLASSRGPVSLPSAYPDHHTTQPCSKSHREDDDHSYDLPIVHPLTLSEPSRANVQSNPSVLISSQAIPLDQDPFLLIQHPCLPTQVCFDFGDPCNDQRPTRFWSLPYTLPTHNGAEHTPPLNSFEDPIGSGLLKARQRLCATCAQPSQHRVDMMKDQSTLVDSLWPRVPHWFHCAPCRAQFRSMMLP